MELLAPAGDWESFLAAIHNGADAVYLGGQSFSARQSAPNFDDAAIQRAVEYAHLHKRKVFVTVNTLIDEREMEPCLEYLAALREMGADAVIVQDSGLICAIGERLPGLHLHGSTQMSAHGAEDLAYWRRQGIERMVVARECSRAELQIMRERCPQMELEIFIHGALCYSCSGQCLFSSLVGGRSGNRGRCAQPCRLAYGLWRDDAQLKLPGRYLLSPADLCLLEQLPLIKELGVSALKIEGRMKRPEYVAVVTAAYRRALDKLDAGGGEVAEEMATLQEVFNRGFTAGHFAPSPQPILNIRRPNHRGVLAGRVVAQRPEGETTLKLSSDLHNGDGLTAWVKEGRHPGVTVTNMKRDGVSVEHAAAGDTVSLWLDGRVGVGDRVFRTYCAGLMEDAAASVAAELKIPVDAQVELRDGQPLRLTLNDREGHSVTVFSRLPAQAAAQQVLTPQSIREKLQRLGATPFVLRELDIAMEGELILPFSELNDLRRQAAEALRQQILTERMPPPAAPVPDRAKSGGKPPARERGAGAAEISVVLSDTAVIPAALAAGADKIYLHLNGIGLNRPVERQTLEQLAASDGGDQIVPVMPALHEDSCARPYRKLAELLPQVMIGRWGDIEWAARNFDAVSADCTLNTFNQRAFTRLLDDGIAQVCLSPELNSGQLRALAARAAHAEVIVHGSLTLMRSRICVLRDTLHPGAERCPRPCRAGSYRLQDDKGYRFRLQTDADCHCYLLNSRSHCLIAELPELWSLGYRRYRIEAAGMTAAELAAPLRVYRRAVESLRHQRPYPLAELRAALDELHPEGYTKGHYFRGVI